LKSTRQPRSSLSIGTFLVATLALAPGCGYHLVGRGGQLPEGVHTVAVPLLENQTRRPEVDQRLTEKLVEELETRSSVRVVADKEGADALLSGVVSGFEASPVLLTAEGRATRYEVTVTARMRLEDLRSGKLLWANDQFVFRQQYDVQTDSGFFDREIQTIDQVAREFAQSVVTAMLEGF
jgi:outer membrane lipopolysaccharide assembly protein LptE/RlpB